MSLDLDLSLDTLIAWKRKPHAMVAGLFGVKPERATGRAIWIVGIGADLGNLGGVLAHAA